MSLKAFHIIFVTIAAICCLMFGGWGVLRFRNTGESAALVAGVVSLGATVLLIVYGRWFLRKLKGESYL